MRDSSKIFLQLHVLINLKQFPLMDSTIHYNEFFANAKIAILVNPPYQYQNKAKNEKL